MESFELFLQEHIATSKIVTFKTDYYTLQVVEHCDTPSTNLRKKISSTTFQPEIPRSNL
jgi:hypothetical protein